MIYEREDRTDFEDFNKHMAPSRRAGKVTLVDFWGSQTGDQQSQVQAAEIDAAEMVVLLLSSDLLNSDQMFPFLQRAMGRRSQGVRLIPVFMRECDIQNTPIGPLVVIPRDKAIRKYTDKDSAWVVVVREIGGVVDDILSRRQASGSGAYASWVQQPTYPMHEAPAQLLYDDLQRAYPEIRQALHLAACAGISTGRVPQNTIAGCWDGILTAASAQGKLTTLVEKALADQNIAGYHQRLRHHVKP